LLLIGCAVARAVFLPRRKRVNVNQIPAYSKPPAPPAPPNLIHAQKL